MLEHMALERGDIEAWAHFRALNGDYIPADPEILENYFHLKRMRDRSIPLPLRLDSRKLLVERGMLKEEDTPITILERISKHTGAERMLNTSVKMMLKEAGEVILLFPDAHVRARVTIKVLESLRGQLDEKLTSLPRKVIVTLDGKRVHTWLLTEDHDLPHGSFTYRIVTDAT